MSSCVKVIEVFFSSVLQPERKTSAPITVPPNMTATRCNASLRRIIFYLMVDINCKVNFFVLSAPTEKSAALAVKPIYVNDGFWQADEVMQAPSVTNTFSASQTWLCLFNTEVLGSNPIRAVPIS